MFEIKECTFSPGEPIRGADGLAVECDPGEAGELIGRIDKGHPVRDFHGYSDNSSTSKKIMKNVFTEGDLYFRSETDNLVSVRNEQGHVSDLVTF